MLNFLKGGKKKQDIQAGFDALKEEKAKQPPVKNPLLNPDAKSIPPEQRYLYQGQRGFDASKTMSPTGESAKSDNTHLLTDPLESFAKEKDVRHYLEVAPTILFTITLVIGALGTALAMVAFQPTNAALINVVHSENDPHYVQARQVVAQEVLRYVTTLPFENVSEIEVAPEVVARLHVEEFTYNELCHLTDVRIILGWSLLLTYIIVTAAVIIIALTRNLQFARRSLFAAGISCLALPVVLGLFLLFFFQPTFVLFHEIFFPQGNWTFPANSLIISTFPEQYWQTIGILWMAIFLINGLVLMGLSRFCGKMHAWSVIER